MIHSLLQDLKYELRRIMTAGAELAKNDARLKNVVPQLLKAGAAAPVMKKLGEMTELLTTPENDSRIQTLFDLSVLLNAVLYTQAKTGKTSSAQLTRLEANEKSTFNNSITFRQASELMNALSTKGSGRYEIIKEAIESNLAFDTRFMPALAASLNDSYSEIPALTAAFLPKFGKSIAAYLLSNFDMQKGTNGNILRIEILAQVLGEEGKDFFFDIYSNGHAKLKPVALAALSSYPEFEEICLKALGNKNADVRSSAYRFFAAKSGDPQADALIKAGIEGEHWEEAINAIVRTEGAYGMKLLCNILEDCIVRKEINDLFTYIIIRFALVKNKAYYDIVYQSLLLILTIPNRADVFVYNIAANLLSYDKDRAVRDLAVCLAALEKISSQNYARTAYIIVRNAFETLPPGEFYDLYHPYSGSVYSVLTNVMEEKAEKIALHNGTFPLPFLNLDERWAESGLKKTYLIAAVAKPGMKHIDAYLEKLLDRNFKNLDECIGCYWYYLGKTQIGARDKFMSKIYNKIEKTLLSKEFIAQIMTRHSWSLSRLSSSLQGHHTNMWWFMKLMLIDPAGFLHIFEKVMAKLGSISGQVPFQRDNIQDIISFLKQEAAKHE